MNGLRHAPLAALAAGIIGAVIAPHAQAQISLNVNIGAPPACPYGYYDYAPYACAPYGYYGPTWFVNGVFVGAGPWFHGPANFHGSVNNRFDPQHGYRGRLPTRGQHADPHRAPGKVAHFKGNETRDGRGHSSGPPRR